jgi:hypothetical protein
MPDPFEVESERRTEGKPMTDREEGQWAHPYSGYEMALKEMEDRLEAAARNARRLEEKAAFLDELEALGGLDNLNGHWRPRLEALDPSYRRLLSSPAVATEDKGGEGK